jgi:ribosomal protein S18 acetylase RimI-like enzyme
MDVEIREEGPGALAAYATVPIAFEVREVLAVEPADDGLGGLLLSAKTLDAPYVKDYDAVPGNRPTEWPARFDLRRWGILSAWAEGARIGGAVVAFDTAGVEMLEERRDLAVLWDLRVAPAMRGRGAGTALFRAAERWAAARGARWLKVETQNVNAAACRFYARQGCTLGAIHRFAYPDLAHEVQLVWYREIVPKP